MRLVLALVVGSLIGCVAYTQEEIDAAHSRIRILASCLDDVAEGIGTGSFKPQYAECINDILGRNGGEGFRVLSEGGLRVPVMELLSTREPQFQVQVDRAGTAQNDVDQKSALTTYQLLLGATASELRELAQSPEAVS